jgi:hypothetical protein
MPYRPRAAVSPSTVARAEAALATAHATILAVRAAQVMNETAEAAAEKTAEAQAAEVRADHYASPAKGTVDMEVKAKALEDQASLWLKQADSNEFNTELRTYYRDKAFEARREAARIRGNEVPKSGSVDPVSRSVSFRLS